MAGSLRNASIEALRDTAEAITAEVRDTFGDLDARQLAWRPQPGEWGVGHCLEHLVISTSLYFEMLRGCIAGTRRPTFWERLPLMARLLGPLLLRSFEPGSSARIQAPAIFKPSENATRAGTVSDFLAMQDELLALLRASAGLPAERIVVTSPVAAYVTYSMLDAYRIIVTHERLHVAQARRVMQAQGFPAPAAQPQAA
jgi:hypothetical protein